MYQSDVYYIYTSVLLHFISSSNPLYHRSGGGYQANDTQGQVDEVRLY